MTGAGAEALPGNDRLAARSVPSRAELLARHEDYLAALGHGPSHRHRQRRGLQAVLDALEAAGGGSWQARWQASGAETDPRAWLARLTPERPELK